MIFYSENSHVSLGSVQDFRTDWGARGVSPLSEAASPLVCPNFLKFWTHPYHSSPGKNKMAKLINSYSFAARIN